MMAGKLAATVLALAFCAATMGCETAMTDPQDGGDEQLTRQDWVAQTIDGKPVVNPGKVTLAFVEGRVSGRAGCNLYSGPVEFGKGTIKVGTLISTKMACMEPGVMQQESAYLNALRSAQRYSIGGDEKLTIDTQSGALVYSGVPKQMRPEGS